MSTRLKREVHVWLDGSGTLDPSSLKLIVDGTRLDDGVRISGREVAFELGRTTDSRKQWARLLGAPFHHPRVRDASLAVLVGNKELSFTCTTPSDQPKRGRFNLERYDPTTMALGLVFVTVIALLTTLLCWRTGMMRDNVIPQVRISERPYSLGRLQMAVWFCVILASFVFILLVTFDLNSINSETFVLLGISGATALGAVAVDKSKDSEFTAIGNSLTGLGLQTLVVLGDTGCRAPRVA